VATDLRARGVKIWLDEAEMGVGDPLIGRQEAFGHTRFELLASIWKAPMTS